jgi:FtsH-binding integral membrane protein
MGFLLGPILNRYLGMQGGAEVVSSAFAMTALVFGGLSAYVLISRKDMSFLSGFITAGFFVLLGAVVASFFFQISGLQLAISAGERLSHFHAEIFLSRRKQSHAFSRRTIGCAIDLANTSEAYRQRLGRGTLERSSLRPEDQLRILQEWLNR